VEREALLARQRAELSAVAEDWEARLADYDRQAEVRPDRDWGGGCAPWGPQERPTVLESQFTQIGPAVGPANSDTRLLLGGSSTIGRTLGLFPDSLDLLHAFQCMVR